MWQQFGDVIVEWSDVIVGGSLGAVKLKGGARSYLGYTLSQSDKVVG